MRAVTFDVGGTLIRPWPSVGHVYAAVATRHGVRVPARLLEERFAAAWRARKEFSYTRHAWSDLVHRVFDGLMPMSEARRSRLFKALYAEFARAEAWRVYPDVIPALERLRKAGIKLGVISNWDERLRPLLKRLGLAQWFGVMVVSSEEGVHKPEARLFRRAVRALGESPGNVLHLGDSATEDVSGAIAAGMRAGLVDRSGRRGGRVLGQVVAGILRGRESC